MSAWRWLLAVVLLAGCLPAVAQQAQPPQPGQAVTLRYKFKPGDSASYHTEMTVNSTTSRAGLPPRQTGITMTMDRRQRVVSVDKQGVASLSNVIESVARGSQTTSDSVAINTFWDGAQMTVRRGGRDRQVATHWPYLRRPYTTKMDTLGRRFGGDPGQEEPRTLLTVGSGNKIFSYTVPAPSFAIVFPKHLVNVGDTWTHLAALPVPQGRATQERVTCKLASVAPDESGRRIAQIEFSAVQVPPKKPGQGAASMKYSATGTILWAVDEGALVGLNAAASGEFVLPQTRISFQDNESIARGEQG